MCVCSHIHVCVCAMCRREFPRIRDTGGCTSPYGHWDWDSGLQLKWQVLLIPEPSHQPLIFSVNRYFHKYKEIVRE